MNKLLKKTISVGLSIAMVATSVNYSGVTTKADIKQYLGNKLDSGQNVILQSGTYYLDENIEFTPSDNGSSGLTIADGQTVTIYLNGHILTSRGSDATAGGNGGNGSTPAAGGFTADGGAGGAGGNGGYAGIKLPKNSTLIFVGAGEVIATGGDAAAGGAGGDGGSGYIYDGSESYDYKEPGSGGGAGGGGGGAGAGIGTDGSNGTAGTAGGYSTSVPAGNSNGFFPTQAANNSTESSASEDSGKLYVYNDYFDAIKITATGGFANTTQSAGGDTGVTYIDNGSDWSDGSSYYHTASTGCGGGSGGSGGAANNIGSGGTGGTGGTGGNSGAGNWEYNEWVIYYGYGGAAGKGGKSGGASGEAGTNGNYPTRVADLEHSNTETEESYRYTNYGISRSSGNSGNRGASGAYTTAFLKGVYAYITDPSKTYKVGDYISQDDISVFEVYNTSNNAEFDGLKPFSTYYNENMSDYNGAFNNGGWFAKSVINSNYKIVGAETSGENEGKLKVTEELIKSLTKIDTESGIPEGIVEVELTKVEAEKAVSKGFVSDVNFDIRVQQTADFEDDTAQAELGDYPTEGEASVYNEEIAVNTIVYDGVKHSLADLLKNSGYGDLNGSDSENEITNEFFMKGLNSSSGEETSYWYSDYALTPFYKVEYAPYKKFDAYTEHNYLTGTEGGVLIDGKTTNSPYYTKGAIDKKYFYNAGYYTVTVVVPYRYYTYRYANSWADVHYFYRTYKLNILIRQADLGIDKASDTVYENTKVQNHTFTRNVEGQNENVYGEFLYSSSDQTWDNDESRSANKATPLVEDIIWEFNIYSLRDQNNYLCQYDGPNTEDELNSYYSNTNGTLLFTEESVAKRTIDMDVTVYYQDEQSEEGTLTPEEDLKSRVITSDDTNEMVNSVYAEMLGYKASINRNDTSLGFRVAKGDAVSGDTTMGTKITLTTLPSQYQAYFDKLVNENAYLGDLYVVTVKAGDDVITQAFYTDDSDLDYTELVKQLTDILPACEFYGVTSYDITFDYVGLYYTTETGAEGRKADWNGDEEFNWVTSQVNFKVDVDQRNISLNALNDIDKIYDGTDYIVSQKVSEDGDVLSAAGYVIDVATIMPEESQFEKLGTTVFFNYYDASGDDSNEMLVEMSGAYEDKNKGADKTALVDAARLSAKDENNSYLNYCLVGLPTEVTGDVDVANMYFTHYKYGTVEVYDSTPMHEVLGISNKAYLLHTELDDDGYVKPADTTFDELVEMDDAKTIYAEFTTDEEEYDYDATYSLVTDKYSPDIFDIDDSTGEITVVPIHSKGGNNATQFPSVNIIITKYGNFTIIKQEEEYEKEIYGLCYVLGKNTLTSSKENLTHILRYRIIGNENTYDVFLPVNQVNNGGHDSKYTDRQVLNLSNGDEVFEYLTLYEEGDDATFKFTVPQNSYLEDLYILDLGDYKSYGTEDIKTFDEMLSLVDTDALGSFNTQKETINASDNPLYLELNKINGEASDAIPEANDQIGGSTFEFTITTGNSVLGNNKGIALVPVFKAYNLVNDEYENNLSVEKSIDNTTGEEAEGNDDFVYVNYKVDFDTDAYNEEYGLLTMSYECPEGETIKTSMPLEEGQIPQYYSMAFNTEDPTYLDFFNPGELIPGTEVEVNIRVWRNGITDTFEGANADDPDAIEVETFKWTVSEEDYYNLFNDDAVMFRTDNSLENIENIKAYGIYDDEVANVKFGKVDRLVEKQEDGTWEAIDDANMLQIADTWYVADGEDGVRVVINNDPENFYPIKSVNGEDAEYVEFGTSFYPTYEIINVSDVDATSVDSTAWTVKETGFARLVFGEINPYGNIVFAEKAEDISIVAPYVEPTTAYETNYENIKPFTFEGWMLKDGEAFADIYEDAGAVALNPNDTIYAKKKVYYAEFYARDVLLTYGIYNGYAETVNFTEMLTNAAKPESGIEYALETVDLSALEVEKFVTGAWYYDIDETIAVEDLENVALFAEVKPDPTVVLEPIVEPEGGIIPKFYLATIKVTEIVADDVEMYIGDTVEEEYTVLPEDAYDQSLEFASNDEEIATVDEDGKITGVGVGTTTITVTAKDQGTVTKEITVVVNPILVSEITIEDAEVIVEDTVQLTAVIAPEDATDKSVTWVSMNEEIATVDEEGNVTGVSVGEVVIKAIANDEGKVEGEAKVTVKPILVSAITLEDVEVFKYDTVQLTPVIDPENATDKSVTWESSDESIATVDENGLVTGVSVGEAVIKATANDDGKVVAEAKVTVKTIYVAEIKLEDATILVGEDVEMKATVAPEEALDKDVTWKSSNEAIATVDENGKVTGIAYGTATITATATDGSGVVGSATVTVKEPEPSKEELKANDIEINKGLKIIPTKTGAKVEWNKVKDAEGYEVFAQICGKKFGKGTIIKVAKDISKIKVKKINGKKLSAKKNYKIRVKAYKTINGKKTYIAKSIVGHFVTKKNKKYTNPKKIKLTKSTFTLKVGKAAKIKGKVIPVNKKKKFLSNKHARPLRFSVADSSVVTVTKKGKITAVGKGTTSVYVYAKNGLTKEVKVTVK